jgi:hypothetical protein
MKKDQIRRIRCIGDFMVIRCASLNSLNKGAAHDEFAK